MTTPKSKRCPRCKSTKPSWEFHMNRNRKDGLSPWCRECRGWNELERRLANKTADQVDDEIHALRCRLRRLQHYRVTMAPLLLAGLVALWGCAQPPIQVAREGTIALSDHVRPRAPASTEVTEVSGLPVSLPPIPPQWTHLQRWCGDARGRRPLLTRLGGDGRVGGYVEFEVYSGELLSGEPLTWGPTTLRVSANPYPHPVAIPGAPGCVYDVPPDLELRMPWGRGRFRISFPEGSVAAGSRWVMQLVVRAPGVNAAETLTSEARVLQVGGAR